ncbi:MAG: hypothetical protein H0V46_03455 [Sphingomonas sp.]|nr:hypothetical protein [Sphingomonas sp.]
MAFGLAAAAQDAQEVAPREPPKVAQQPAEAGGEQAYENASVFVAYGEAAAAKAKNSVSKCQTRSFQSTTSSVEDGERNQANILLCAKAGETDEQWIQTLQKTSALVAESLLSDAAKLKLRAELQAEIARVRADVRAAN